MCENYMTNEKKILPCVLLDRWGLTHLHNSPYICMLKFQFVEDKKNLGVMRIFKSIYIYNELLEKIVGT